MIKYKNSRVGLFAVSLLHFVPQHAYGVPLLSLTQLNLFTPLNFTCKKNPQKFSD